MDEKKKRDEEPTAAPVGKQFAGQKHYAVTTPESEAARVELQKAHDSPDAIGLDAYFAVKAIRDPVMQASMRAFTTVRNATLTAWDEIFKSH